MKTELAVGDLDRQQAVAKARGNVRETPTPSSAKKRGEIVTHYLGAPNFAKSARLIEQLLGKG